MDYQLFGNSLLPFIFSEDQSRMTSSLSSTSGYATGTVVPSSPVNNTESSHYSPWNAGYITESHCCSLINPIWKNTGTEIQQPDRMPTSSSFVTLDAEHIPPRAARHHPLDVDSGSGELFHKKPWGIATNKHTEQIYIADRHHHNILVFGPDGEFQQAFGGHGKEPGFFNRPAAVAYDSTYNRLLVSDKDNHRIQVLDATSGQFLFSFGSEGSRSGQLRYPWGVAVSPDGSHIAVADSRNKRIQLFTSEGSFVRARHHDIVYPRGITFDNTGNFIYFTDFNRHQVFRINISFHGLKAVVKPGLLRPSGIDVDAAGNILVCDTKHHLIKTFCPNGFLLGTVGSIGGLGFGDPLDVSVMKAGHIAVLDMNGRVRIF